MTHGPAKADQAGSELRRRIAHLTAEVSRALGDGDRGEVTSADADGVRGLISALETRLADVADESGWQVATAAHDVQMKRLQERSEARFLAIGLIHDAIARLREITSPSTILSRAPRYLCLASDLDRAVLSLVRDGFLVAEATYFRDDAAGAAKALEALAATPPRLEHPLIETEVLRRRRASIVTEAQVHPRAHKKTAAIMGWQTYLAAPVVVGGKVIGSIHADTSRRPLDVLDGDVLWIFASGLGEIYETTSLRRSLRAQQSDIRRFLEWLGARSGEINGAAMQLGAEPAPPPDPPGPLEAPAHGGAVDDGAVFDGLLTRRELEVLRLVARGDTNGAIAAQLVISEGTVKFHMGNLLEKLRASNRAEAASRYHRLVQLGPREAEPPAG